MSAEQKNICESYLRDHWDEDISTERLLTMAAEYTRIATNKPFDESDAAECCFNLESATA